MTPNFYSLSKSLRHHENLTAGGGDSGSMSATGATETTYTDSGTEYTVQTWTSSGSFEITGTLTVEMLVVAGGGTGGWWYNGGAGAGGFKYFSQIALSAETYTTTIGATNTNSSVVSGDSSTNIISLAGANADSGTENVHGSGGGSNSATIRDGTPNQGNDGGSGDASGSGAPNAGCGGGGGARSVGGNGSKNNNGGAGGGAYTDGTSTVYDWTADDGSTADFKINGTGNSYAGGAGGGVQVGTGGSGGVGEDGTRVGGGGGDNNGVGSSTPVASTGSGGSSTGGSYANRSGASGIIIIRYPS